VDEPQKRIVHHVRVGLNPNDVGVDLVRTYVCDGSRLKLRAKTELEDRVSYGLYFEQPSLQLHPLSE